MLTKKIESKASLPRILPGFEAVRRYRDPSTGAVIAKLLPGDFYVTCEDEVLDTVLGSCVSACIRSAKGGVGGMNHFMLPGANSSASDSWGGIAGSATRYGLASMEQLINRILSIGKAQRSDLEVKIFGGARVLAATTDIGQHNVNFVRDFLKQEGLRVVAEDVGDVTPRHLQYFPLTGRVRVKHLGKNQTEKIASQEQTYLKGLEKAPVAGSIEFF